MSSYSTHRPARSIGDAVRLFCLECTGSMVNTDRDGNETIHYRTFTEVKECPSERTCSLWPYRFGKTGRKGTNPDGNPEALRSFRQAYKQTDCSNPDANTD